MISFARLRRKGIIIPAVKSGEAFLDLSRLVTDISSEVIAGGLLDDLNLAGLAFVDGDFTFEAPIADVRQIAATGFNYKQHIAEMKVPTPTEPDVF